MSSFVIIPSKHCEFVKPDQLKKITEPTADQIRNCQGFGWHYCGEDIFSKGDLIGWFEGRHFIKA